MTTRDDRSSPAPPGGEMSEMRRSVVRIGIAGIAGRMGGEVLAAASPDPAVAVAGGLDRPDRAESTGRAIGRADSGVRRPRRAAAGDRRPDRLHDAGGNHRPRPRLRRGGPGLRRRRDRARRGADRRARPPGRPGAGALRPEHERRDQRAVPGAAGAGPGARRLRRRDRRSAPPAQAGCPVRHGDRACRSDRRRVVHVSAPTGRSTAGTGSRPAVPARSGSTPSAAAATPASTP